MFSKGNKARNSGNPDQAAPIKAAPPSIVSNDLKIVGDLHSDGEIQIDGAVEGDIRTRSLLIGESATIKGEVVAESIVVHGTVNGQMKARSVRLAKTARVVGDIVHHDLAIEKGAFLEGHCKRMVEAPAKDKSKTSTGAGAGEKASGTTDAVVERKDSKDGNDKKTATASG